MELHKFIVYLGTAIILIAFFVAIIFIKKENPAYFKYIFAFIILGLLMSLNTFFAIYIIRSISKMTQAIEKVIILFQFVSLGFFS